MFPIKEYKRNTSGFINKSFAKMVTSTDVVKNAVLDMDRFKVTRDYQDYTDLEPLMRALNGMDIPYMRRASEFFMRTSGIYNRLISYLSNILLLYWHSYPYLLPMGYSPQEVMEEHAELMRYFDLFSVGDVFNEITHEVVSKGVFYGYLMNGKQGKVGSIMQLPSYYCRSRYKYNGSDAVEFNLKYFDTEFRTESERLIVLDSFPKEFKKAYALYKAGEIEVDSTDRGAWFLCDLDLSMRFAISDNEVPFMITVTPAILDLEAAKVLDKQKSMQELLKILIQKMPMDKNGEMIFDMDEAVEMHKNAVNMMSNAIGVDVLTTFADVDTVDLDSSSGATAASDPTQRVERALFNEAGVSQNLLNTDGNLALEKSILNDEAVLFILLRKYQTKINQWINKIFNFKYEYKVSLPPLTIYNRETFYKAYKEGATAGYSKLMPAIARGFSQSEFLSMNVFENDILHLSDNMTPLQISSTQSSESSSNSDGEGTIGAPEKPDDEKSEKTLQNKESMS